MGIATPDQFPHRPGNPHLLRMIRILIPLILTAGTLAFSHGQIGAAIP
ncbi:hypothetical protein [Profundibacterium mesophilum]|nr:hypothetical protein [Profundibacterium mesophilum]